MGRRVRPRACLPAAAFVARGSHCSQAPYRPRRLHPPSPCRPVPTAVCATPSTLRATASSTSRTPGMAAAAFDCPTCRLASSSARAAGATGVRIQAAIDLVSSMAPDANGFRGAVLLEPRPLHHRRRPAHRRVGRGAPGIRNRRGRQRPRRGWHLAPVADSRVGARRAGGDRRVASPRRRRIRARRRHGADTPRCGGLHAGRPRPRSPAVNRAVDRAVGHEPLPGLAPGEPAALAARLARHLLGPRRHGGGRQPPDARRAPDDGARRAVRRRRRLPVRVPGPHRACRGREPAARVGIRRRRARWTKTTRGTRSASTTWRTRGCGASRRAISRARSSTPGPGPGG